MNLAIMPFAFINDFCNKKFLQIENKKDCYLHHSDCFMCDE